MYKKMTAVVVCLLILLSLALPAAAQETGEEQIFYVYGITDFLILAQKCRLDSFSLSLTVELKTDIDLTGTDFVGIPVFCGTFNGNGHTIRGLNILSEGSAQSFFRYLKDTALVQDLIVEGNVAPGGTRAEVGGIAGSNEGRIVNCRFNGSVTGADYVGGITGVNAVSGIVENCQSSGSVTGDHFAGGIAGKNSGVIRGCENFSDINTTAQQNRVQLSDITVESIAGTEAAVTVTDVGGISGSSNGVIRNSINRGDVGYRHMGYNIGGITGTQSGLIQDCQNYGSIQGRKEVGGIVGQMEPTAMIRYEEDALQILQRQLNGMGSIVDDTVSNVQGSSDAIMNQVGMLKGHVGMARDAVEILVPGGETEESPDMDTVQAAQNNLSNSLSGMSQTLQGMGGTVYSSMGAISTNLHSMQNQMNAMRNTLGNISETLGGSITDVSDRDTDQDLMGKVVDSANYGFVQADRNGGGIAGAVAMENDLDHEEDWSLSGSNSLNFESELRAVIKNCENTGLVTVKKENCGGIAGWQSIGLIKNCSNSGILQASGADYVGGISGQSKGFIRGCTVKTELSGTNCVGGIAGSATVLTDCRSLVKLIGTGENVGEVIGLQEDPYQPEEHPVSGNYYLADDEDQGGVDGISYADKAEALPMEVFLLQEGISTLFQTVNVRFRYADGVERSFSVPLGGSFDKSWAPPIPPVKQSVVYWKDLAETDLTNLMFDVVFETGRSALKTVIGSKQMLNGQPLLLVQGMFHQNVDLEVAELLEGLPETEEIILGAWEFVVSGAESITVARLRLPADCDGEKSGAMLRGSDGTWRTAQTHLDGSCLVIPLEAGDDGILLYQKNDTYRLILICAGAAIPLLVAMVYRIRKRRK